ncbi:MAG: hypothetical protein V4580_18720 [Bacteroidota bacterium]
MVNISSSLKSAISVVLVTVSIAFFTCNNEVIEYEPETTLGTYSSISMIGSNYKIDSSIAMANGTKQKMLLSLNKENLIEKKTVEEIPDFIKTFLDGISENNNFDIADLGEEWQDGSWTHSFEKNTSTEKATAYIAKPFPTRQLIYCGVGKNVALISYYTGGIRMAQHVMILKFEGQKMMDLWFDNNSYGCDSGANPGTKKDGLIKYVKSMTNNNC